MDGQEALGRRQGALTLPIYAGKRAAVVEQPVGEEAQLEVESRALPGLLGAEDSESFELGQAKGFELAMPAALAMPMSAPLPTRSGKGLAGRLAKEADAVAEVSAEMIQSQVGQIVDTLSEVLGANRRPKNGPRLTGFDVELFVSVSGEVGLFGTGASAEAGATISLHFEIREEEKE